MPERDSSVAFADDGVGSTYADSATEASTLAERRKPASWLVSSIRRLGNLLALPANWDSYGGKPVDKRSARYAELFLIELSRIEGIPEPAITASPDGHIALAWDFGQASMEVEVRPDGRWRYVYLDEADEQRDRENITSNSSSIINILTMSYTTAAPADDRTNRDSG